MQNRERDQMHEETKYVELLIGRIMRIGVIAAVVVLLIGLVLMLFQGGNYATGSQPHRFGTIFTGLLHGQADAVMMVGLFLLILTPVLRVVVSIYAFMVEHDRLYVWITTVVLVILAVAMVIGYFG
ncbi:DUF1634 domain-containing protein [Lacticaseibacillus pantheris]|jgi:uncharacterized membrane protein|uniref:Integral membrane protein n=1 Tax=Lacticaseibacillus pantheris DSM 15945 = JCM 12539 = NBRC 106106 TaxID=1423783 RepID=A0A0R1U4G5_9LACO|nr:DUF1634 domain-containing protein [Lacticaseibacillus pantheris]KRL88135.1 hypothetical protein FC50_GL000331 [Lacticaseibacillus pantheris DSM 15945 = JCM 12539 = NBRC 106106]WKF83894.1 DUF1634 domain-containing protein [Lacticaseibacillus pantheris]